LFYYYWSWFGFLDIGVGFWISEFRLWQTPEMALKPYIVEVPIRLMDLPINSCLAAKLNLFL